MGTLLRGRALRLGWSLLLLLALSLVIARTAHAQDAGDLHRAGLVIVPAEGEVVTRCVEFAEESLNGYELLSRSGLAVQGEQAAMGMTICSLEGTGCNFPAESCFCQCTSSPCVYWSYWELSEEGGWDYSNAGSSNTQVRDGTVQGWVWGEGSSGAAPEPPALAFADICAAPQEETPVSAAQGADLAPVESADAPLPGAAAPAAAPSWGSALLWGTVVLLPLAGFALFGRRAAARRREP